MSIRKHFHQESFPVDPECLFELLHTPSHIRHWWRAAQAIVLPEAGGFWAATWGDSRSVRVSLRSVDQSPTLAISVVERRGGFKVLPRELMIRNLSACPYSNPLLTM